MTEFGAIPTEIEAGVLVGCDCDDITSPVSTTSATLEDITGLSFDVTIPTGRTGRIKAALIVQCSTTGGSPATGGWATSIGGVDGTEIQRYLSGTSDTGAIGAAQTRKALSAGTYTIKGRHRRVSGASTVNTDAATLTGMAVLE